MTARVMIVVTHLLGSGHLARAALLARAFVAEGQEVLLVSGGRPAAHIDLSGLRVAQLPPLFVEGADFSRMYGEGGGVADAAYLTRRASKLLELFGEFEPNILITELFPFGRRSLKAEFEALLKAARDAPSSPRVFASVRDILAPPSKPSKAEYAAECIAQFYDGVLVHSDPKVVSLGLSWPLDARLEKALRYTGFIAPAAPQRADRRGQSTLVTAGGGDVGAPIFDLALKAARLDSQRQWHLLVGGSDAGAEVARWRTEASDNVTVEPARTDFRELLSGARASVSMCGYNTAMDVLQTGVPSVILPYDAGGEVEQGLRATALSNLPGIQALRLAGASASDLLAALERAERDEPRKTTEISFDGAAETVRICLSRGSEK